MGEEIRYGVISDVHYKPELVPIALDVLKREAVDYLLVNGDVGDILGSLYDSQDYVARILNSIGESELEAYIQPGNHETLLAFGPVMDYFAEEYSNLIDVTKNQKIKQKGHDLVFLPGGDLDEGGGEYLIENNEQRASGRYMQTEGGLQPFDDFKEYWDAVQKKIATGAKQYSNINDLRSLVKNPDKTILMCHIPRKFNNLETCVDMAEFGELKEDFYFQGDKVKKGWIYPLPEVEKVIRNGGVIEVKKENRGNIDLKNIYEEIGINKAVSGHFHESGHRANDRFGNPIPQGEFVDELFWNSGCLDFGQTGILTVDGGKVSYRNINLQDYLK